jgi:hypothetical protein
MIKDKALKLVNELIAENKALKAALAQPAQEPDHGDELTIAYMSGVHRGKELAAQPAQEPVFWYRPVAQPGGYEGPLHNSVIEKVRKESGSWKPLYTTPQQRPWVGLTEDEMDKVRQSVGYNQFMSAGEYAKLVQFVTQTKLKETNNG